MAKDPSDIRRTTGTIEPFFSLIRSSCIACRHLILVGERLTIHRHAGEHGIVQLSFKNVRIIAIQVELK